MKCEDIRERLVEYHEGELDGEGRMHIEAHLRNCKGCREELRAIEGLLCAVAALPVPDPWPGFARRLHARIEKDKQERSPRWMSGLRLRLAWSASISLVLVVGGLLWALLSLAGFPIMGERGEVTTAIDLPLRNVSSQEEVKSLLELWPSRRPDWAVLREGEDRQLVSLAFRDEGLNVQDVVGLWATTLRERIAMEALVEIMELSDSVLEEFLVRVRG